MRKAGIVFFLLLTSALSTAQSPSRGNVYFGYSYGDANRFGFANNTRLNFNGWAVSVEAKVLPWVGFVADFDRRSGSPSLFVACPPGPAPRCAAQVVNIHQSDFLFGPRAFVSIGKFRPFGEVLVGLEHVTTDQFGPDKSFAIAGGGGFDYRLAKHLAVRAEGDFVRTSLFAQKQNDLRATTGFLWRF